MAPSKNVQSPAAKSKQAHRLAFFDGLRGAAALGVVVSHLFQHFYPPMYAPGPQDEISRLLGSSPLSAFYNGQFSVWIFFVLSGLVLSASVDRGHFPLFGTILRRYVRLTLPILAVTLLILVIARVGFIATDRVAGIAPLASELYPADFAPSIVYWLRNSLFGVYLTGESDFENVLWTMKVEIWGSLYVFFVWHFAGDRRRRIIVNAIAAVALSRVSDSSSLQGLVLFPLGIILYDISKAGLSGTGGWVFPIWLGIGTLMSGIEFGAWRLKQPAFPGANVITHTLHDVLPFIDINRGEAQQFGAVLVVAAVAFTPALQSVLSTVPFRLLGAVSFPLYLCHLPVIATVGCVVFADAYAAWGFSVASLVTIPTTIIVSFGLAALLTVVVERPSIKASHAAGRLALRIPILWRVRPMREN